MLKLCRINLKKITHSQSNMNKCEDGKKWCVAVSSWKKNCQLKVI